MSIAPLDALPLETLRRRSSTKWRTYPEHVIPMFVAETDFPLAPPITAALREAVEIGDTGYTPPEPGLRAGFVEFAKRRFGWELEPRRVRSTGDVMMGVVELLRATIAPGDRVIITPPVYPPFSMCIPEAGGVVESVPLVDTGESWQLDLDGIEAALAAGARAVLLCNPHNPTGTAHSRDSLARLAAIAKAHDAVVVSDEIHAPLVLDGHEHVPYLSIEGTADHAVAVTAASKAFNTPGLRCAQIVTGDEATMRRLLAAPMARNDSWSPLGVIAATAAFRDGDAWLTALRARLSAQRDLLAGLLAEHLPDARMRPLEATYLAWLDLRAYHDDPAGVALEKARVWVQDGRLFQPDLPGHVRLNIATSPERLTEIVRRMAAALA